MSTPDRDNQRLPADHTPATKKPYAKPAFRFERVFETTALSCGKIAGTQGPCSGFGKKHS